jgi:hypothetical protein
LDVNALIKVFHIDDQQLVKEIVIHEFNFER